MILLIWFSSEHGFACGEILWKYWMLHQQMTVWLTVWDFSKWSVGRWCWMWFIKRKRVLMKCRGISLLHVKSTYLRESSLSLLGWSDLSLCCNTLNHNCVCFFRVWKMGYKRWSQLSLQLSILFKISSQPKTKQCKVYVTKYLILKPRLITFSRFSIGEWMTY